MSRNTAKLECVRSSSSSLPSLRSGLDFFLINLHDILSASTGLGTYIQPIAKSSILSLLGKLEYGQLHFESLGVIHSFGKPYTLTIVDGYNQEDLRATIKVKDEGFWVRLFLHYDLGFADSFMLDMIEADRLDNVFKIFLLNRQALSKLRTLISPVIHLLGAVANSRMANGILGSKRNIDAHYNLSNEVFLAFMSRDLTYTCGYFDANCAGPYGDLIEDRPVNLPDAVDSAPDDLEKAMLSKHHEVAKRAKLTKGSKVLEIGCGWGTFAIIAAKYYGANVIGITLSLEQKLYAEAKIAEAGLEDQITVHLMDYRDIPKNFEPNSFDAIVAIGVMEHVGRDYMNEWFRIMSWALHKRTGIMVFAMSTLAENEFRNLKTTVTFLQKYIFPGGDLSSVQTLVNSLTAAGFEVDSIENYDIHYVRTLREWKRRFQRHFQTHIVPALQSTYKDLDDDDIEIFRRKYIYYFTYAGAGFEMGYIADMLFVLTREMKPVALH